MTAAVAARLTRLGIATLAVLVLTTLLGAATALQPPAAAAAGPAASAGGMATSAAVSPVAAAGQLPARNVKMGCPGPDALCDLGGDAVDCAKDPIDCGTDAAGEVKDNVGNLLNGAGDVLDGATGLLPDGCGILDAICDGGLPGVAGLPNVGDLFGGGIPGLRDIPNPFEAIGDVIAKAAADAWTAAMLAVWNSGLFVLRIVLTFSELFLTPDLRAETVGRFDGRGFVLFSSGLVLVSLALQGLGERALGAATSLVMLVAGLAAMVGYWLHAARVERPLFALTLFRIPTFTVGLAGNLFARLGSGAMPFLMPLFLQIGLGHSPATAGMSMIPTALGAMLCKAFAEPLIRAALGEGDYELEWSEAVGGTRSPLDTPLWDVLTEFTAGIEPGARLAPIACPGFTDSHYLREAFGTVAYGFFPARAMDPELATKLVHSANERAAVDDLELGVDMLRSAALGLLG